MKKIIFLLMAIVFTVTSVKAGSILQENVPVNVKSYVTKNYSSANYVKWDIKDNGAYYKAQFTIGGRDVKLKIQNNGTLISSKEDMLIKDIPSFATDYVSKNYRNAEVLGANKYVDAGNTTYSVGIRFDNSQGYERHRNIVFDSKGNLIRK